MTELFIIPKAYDVNEAKDLLNQSYKGNKVMVVGVLEGLSLECELRSCALKEEGSKLNFELAVLIDDSVREQFTKGEVANFELPTEGLKINRSNAGRFGFYSDAERQINIFVYDTPSFSSFSFSAGELLKQDD